MLPVRKLLQLLNHERQDIFSIYFYAILSGLVQLSLPLGIQSIVSFVQAGSVSASLVLLIVLVILGVGIGGLLRVNVMKIIEKIQQQLFVRYSFSYVDTLPRLNLRALDGYYLPELMNRFFDTATLQKGIGKLLLDIPAASIQIVFGLILLSFYHPVFIFFGALLLLVLWLIFRATGNAGLESSLEESDYKYKVGGYLQEMGRVIHTVKFSRSDSLHIEKTDTLVTGYLQSRTRHFHILKLQYWTLIVFKLLITAAMLIIGVYLLVNQLLNIGQFVSAEIIILLVINSVEKLIVNLDNVYDTLTSVEKITKVTEKPVEDPGMQVLAPAATGLKLTARNLSFGFTGEDLLLNKVSFDILPGEKIALTGPVGSGKSTLLRLMGGIYTSVEGSLMINDLPVSAYNGPGLRAHIGILLQQHADIFEGTLYDNICLGCESISVSYLNTLAATVGLLPFVESSADGYRMYLLASGQGLSGRTIRKILLMRALVHKPRLLLLEEPWLGLAEDNIRNIQQYLLGLPETTVLVATNDPGFAGRCDKTFKLEGGNIINI